MISTRCTHVSPHTQRQCVIDGDVRHSLHQHELGGTWETRVSDRPRSRKMGAQCPCGSFCADGDCGYDTLPSETMATMECGLCGDSRVDPVLLCTNPPQRRPCPQCACGAHQIDPKSFCYAAKDHDDEHDWRDIHGTPLERKLGIRGRPPKFVYPPEVEQAIKIITDVNVFHLHRNTELRRGFLTLRHAIIAFLTEGEPAVNQLDMAMQETAFLASDLESRVRP